MLVPLPETASEVAAVAAALNAPDAEVMLAAKPICAVSPFGTIAYCTLPPTASCLAN
jgi:uncharacterized membrane protein YadS